MEYLGMAILVIATVAVIALPIVRADASGEEPEAVDLILARLEEEKESAYNALKEAEFDYKTGKLSDEDYKSIKDKYSNKAMEALHELEEYEKQMTVDSRQLTEEETNVGRVLRTRQGELDEEKTTIGQKVEAKFCGDCGSKLSKDDKFCPGCGSKIK